MDSEHLERLELVLATQCLLFMESNIPPNFFPQDIYGLYDPRYRPYDSSASAYAENHRYSEPERPSSRASHYSDQLTPRCDLRPMQLLYSHIQLFVLLAVMVT